MPTARWPTGALHPGGLGQCRTAGSARAGGRRRLHRGRHPGRPQCAGPTFGLDSVLATRFWTAVKTGTSKDMRDNWVVGWSRATPWACGWAMPAARPCTRVSGTSGAAPVWAEVMGHLHARQPSRPPQPPAGVAQQAVRYGGRPGDRRAARKCAPGGSCPARPGGIPDGRRRQPGGRGRAHSAAGGWQRAGAGPGHSAQPPACSCAPGREARETAQWRWRVAGRTARQPARWPGRWRSGCPGRGATASSWWRRMDGCWTACDRVRGAGVR
jgi:hypothetical protein